MRIDLHTHTTYSDGTDSPAELMRAASAAGVGTVGVTDHDTTAGWAACEQARPAEVALVRGAELSTHVVADGRRIAIHVLAYLFDPTDSELAAELRRLREDRLDRAMLIVQKMVDDGVPISRAQVLRIAGHAPVGRPHIARALMEAGLVGSVTEAFGSYLSYRQPYYVSKSDTELNHALRLVREAGGVPVVAHARSRGAGLVTSREFFAAASKAGLLGVEVDHPDHTPADRAELRAIAEELDLIPTGSSDYHGANKALRIGQETTSTESLQRIVAASSGRVPVLCGPALDHDGCRHLTAGASIGASARHEVMG